MTDYDQAVARRLAERGWALPAALPPPAGLYEAYRLEAGLGFLSAQFPGYGADSLPGRVGHELTVEQGVEAARRSALNALARIHEALGGFTRLKGLLHLAGHVASADEFWDQPLILDGASQVLLEVLGDRGRHSRTAFAHPRLPRNVSIELQLTFAYHQ